MVLLSSRKYVWRTWKGIHREESIYRKTLLGGGYSWEQCRRDAWRGWDLCPRELCPPA